MSKNQGTNSRDFEGHLLSVEAVTLTCSVPGSERVPDTFPALLHMAGVEGPVWALCACGDPHTQQERCLVQSAVQGGEASQSSRLNSHRGTPCMLLLSDIGTFTYLFP